METIQPLAVIEVGGEKISLYNDKQVAVLLTEKKLPYETLEYLSEIFTDVYPELVKKRLQAQWGMPTTVDGALVKGRDNIDYATALKFVEAMDYDREVCEMVCNTKNIELRRQIMNMGLPMMCLMTRKNNG